jgi:hypothetical protein
LSTHLHEELISKIFLVVVTGDEWLDTVPVLGMNPQERTSSKLIKYVTKMSRTWKLKNSVAKIFISINWQRIWRNLSGFAISFRLSNNYSIKTK